jgi:acylphosphatase
MHPASEIECWSARIRGRVQGVGFRDTTAHQAKRLGLTGWVRNRLDGSVEVLLVGPHDTMQRMKAWLHHGPPMARVDEVELQPIAAPFPRFERFERRTTE